LTGGFPASICRGSIKSVFSVALEIYHNPGGCMKKFLILQFFAGALMIGCASLPPEIDKDYLAQITPEQSESLKKIEIAIVAKKDEKDVVEKRLPLAEKMVDMSKARLNLLEASKDLNVIEVKYNEIKKDQKKVDELTTKGSDLDRQTELQKKRIPLSVSQRKTIQSLLDLRTAELAVLVADLSNAKAVIANDFLLRQAKVAAPPADSKKKPDQKIDLATFSEFLAKQKDSQKKAAEDYASQLKDYNTVRDEAVKAGYKGEDDLDVK
jgi:hypothetical protein